MPQLNTKTPWRIFTTPDGRKLVGIGAENGEGVLDAGFGVWAWKDAEGIANAELVVRAVNAHDVMLAALRSVGAILSSRPATQKDDELWGAYSQVIAAIAKAEGQS